MASQLYRKSANISRESFLIRYANPLHQGGWQAMKLANLYLGLSLADGLLLFNKGNKALVRASLDVKNSEKRRDARRRRRGAGS